MKKHYTALALLLISIYCQAQSPEQNLKKLGIQFQEPNAPVANDVNYVRTENLIYYAGSGSDKSYNGVIKGNNNRRRRCSSEAKSKARSRCNCIDAFLG